MTGRSEAPLPHSALGEPKEPTPRSLVLLFPGQGLAAEDIFNYYAAINDLSGGVVRRYLKAAEELSSIPLLSILEDRDSSALESTAIMQPVVYALSMAAFELVRQREKIVSHTQFVAGHSLGEYAALTAAQVFSFEDGMRMVTKRGELMEEACKKRPSRLISVLGWGESQIQDFCRETGTQMALVNAPTNIVIGCLAEKVEEVADIIKTRGARRIIPLTTAGAFHTEFMQDAANGLNDFLNDFEFKDPQCTVVANLTGQASKSGRALRSHMIESMVNPVRWADSVGFMNQENVIFYEIGPGNSLAALNRQNAVPSEKTKDISYVFSSILFKG